MRSTRHWRRASAVPYINDLRIILISPTAIVPGGLGKHNNAFNTVEAVRGLKVEEFSAMAPE